MKSGKKHKGKHDADSLAHRSSAVLLDGIGMLQHFHPKLEYWRLRSINRFRCGLCRFVHDELLVAIARRIHRVMGTEVSRT